MAVTIDEENRYFTTSALKELMKVVDDEIQAVNAKVEDVTLTVSSCSGLWNEVSGLSAKQDKIDFEYKPLEM